MLKKHILMSMAGAPRPGWWESLSPGDWVEEEKGYFVGLIKNDSDKPLDVYALILAQKEYERSSTNYLDSNNLLNELRDGRKATTYVAKHLGWDRYKEGVFAAIAGTGLDDWYVPSIEELVLIYSNLKPTNKPNVVNYAALQKSPNAVPPVTITANKPTTTTSPPFLDLREERLSLGDYIASGRHNAMVILLSFSDSKITTALALNYSTSSRVRPVRRVYCYTEKGAARMATLGALQANANLNMISNMAPVLDRFDIDSPNYEKDLL